MTVPSARREEFLRRLPKVELHCHFEGSVPLPIVRELAQKHGVTLPDDETGEFYSFLPDRDRFMRQVEGLPPWVARAFSRKYQRPVLSADALYELGIYEAFLDRFDTVCETLIDADDFSRAAYGSLVEAADVANIRYREMYFHPMNHPGVPYRRMLEGLLDGIRAAETDRNITCKLIPSINRDHSVAAGNEMVDMMLASPVDEVVGLSTDYDEEHLPAFVEAYRRAASAGLPGTAHAGEYGSAQTVRECIEVLGISRIDHGYSIADDPELMQTARDAGVHFTAIFSYAVAIHRPELFPIADRSLDPAVRIRTPVADMLEAGLSVSLGSDDPSFHGFADLATEYVTAAGCLDLNDHQCEAFTSEAIDAAWCSDSERSALRSEIASSTAELRSELSVDPVEASVNGSEPSPE